jgi:DNA-directed RNA polymerase specialized sigma24 family protein
MTPTIDPTIEDLIHLAQATAAWARRIWAPQLDREDAFQEAALAVLQHLARGGDPGAWRNARWRRLRIRRALQEAAARDWAAMRLPRAYLDGRRRTRVRSVALEDARPPPQAPDPAALAEQAEAAQALIAAALAALPADLRPRAAEILLDIAAGGDPHAFRALPRPARNKVRRAVRNLYISVGG